MKKKTVDVKVEGITAKEANSMLYKGVLQMLNEIITNNTTMGFSDVSWNPQCNNKEVIKRCIEDLIDRGFNVVDDRVRGCGYIISW